MVEAVAAEVVGNGVTVQYGPAGVQWCTDKMLEGIALGKYDKIEKAANELVRISKTAEWLANRQPRYAIFANEFQEAAETIAKKAKDKNMDGVMLAYFTLTKSCVRCHQHLREVRDARNFRLPEELCRSGS